MEITLIRTGGFIPLIKKATKEVDWSEREINELINVSKADDKPAGARDNHQFQLGYNNQTYMIDLEKIPGRYKELFEKLKDNMQVVKQA